MSTFQRGRGGQSNNSPRRPGDAPVKDYRTTPQSSNRPYGGKTDSPRNPPPRKPEAEDSKVTPSTNATEKSQTPSQSDKGGRPRSRSPIKRTDTTKAPATANNVDGAPAAATTNDKDDKGSFRYCGRPGEKKFSGRCRLFVANLHNTTTEPELKELFGEFGETGEVYVNKEKGFGFIRLDYRHNAEMAKLTLDKKLLKGRNIQVRYATHASAIELHGLDNYASNAFIEKAMSTFGAVERCIVVCDDRGRSKGYAIVEFEWKKSAAKVLDRLKDEMFVLGRLPKPVFAKPYILTDEEEGVSEEALERLDGLEQEREHPPRFISPNSFEYTWAKRWRDLFIEEQDKKARLEQELTDARCKLEFEMEAAIRQQEASRIREELARRQEELRMLEEDMMRRQEADMRILERSRQRELAARQGRPEPVPRDQQELHQNEMQLSRENAARQQDFNHLRQRAEMTLQSEGGGGGGGGYQENQSPQQRGPPRQHPGGKMPPQHGFGGPQRGGPPQQGGYGGGFPQHPGQQGGAPRQMHPGVMDYRNQQGGRGPPPREMQQREMQQREMQQREMHQRGDAPPRDGPPRDMPPRDGQRDGPPRDMPPREVPTRDLPAPRDMAARDIPGRDAAAKEKTEDKKTTEPPAANKPVEVDPSKRPPRR